MKYDLLIFDADGTLIDSYAWFVETLLLASQKFHFISPCKKDILLLRELGTKDILKKLGVATWKIPKIASFFRNEMQKSQGQIKPFAAVEKTLKKLSQQNCLLALTSSNSIENLQALLGPSIMEQFGSVKTGTALFGKHIKLKQVLKELKIQPSKALYIADETRDCFAAKKVGLHFGLATWGYQSSKAFQSLEVDHSFNSFKEIEKLLEA